MASKSFIYGNKTSHQIPSYPTDITRGGDMDASWVGFPKTVYLYSDSDIQLK